MLQADIWMDSEEVMALDDITQVLDESDLRLERRSTVIYSINELHLQT